MTSASKCLSLDDLLRRRREWRAAGKTVVWKNGCFDLLHAGHIQTLESAKALGDILIVALNTDRSIRELKGEGRPLVSQDDRAALVAALACVDHVLLFDGKRCTDELRAVQPDIYAQGGDYTIDTIDQTERAAVEGAGGRIVFLPLVDGLSTSLLLKKIRRADPEKIVSAAFSFLTNAEGKLLLVATRYANGVRWGLPGGGQNRGERLSETAVRECREEIGLDVRVRRHAGVIERIDPAMSLHLVLHLFEVEAEGEPRANAAEDIVDLGWFDVAALRAHPGRILGRAHWIRYLIDPAAFPSYIFMGPGEE